MEKAPISYAEILAYFQSARDPQLWEIKKKKLKNRLGGEILIRVIEREMKTNLTEAQKKYKIPKEEAIKQFYEYGGEKFGYKKRYEDWRKGLKGKEKVIDALKKKKKPRRAPFDDPSIYEKAWEKIKGFFTPGPSLAEQGERYMKEKHPDRYR
jgi:hypothetical protein